MAGVQNKYLEDSNSKKQTTHIGIFIMKPFTDLSMLKRTR